MTKAIYTISPAYQRAAERRQRYLDFLNAHPGSIAADIEHYMLDTYGETVKSTNTTRQLCMLGEVRREEYKRAYRYFPIATVTTSAETMRQRHMEANAKYNQGRKGSGHAEKRNSKPGHYVHKAGEYDVPGHKQGHPLKSQEGIGSGRAKTYVGCVAMGASLGL
jgi:hypothetical protein